MWRGRERKDIEKAAKAAARKKKQGTTKNLATRTKSRARKSKVLA